MTEEEEIKEEFKEGQEVPEGENSQEELYEKEEGKVEEGPKEDKKEEPKEGYKGVESKAGHPVKKYKDFKQKIEEEHQVRERKKKEEDKN